MIKKLAVAVTLSVLAMPLQLPQQQVEASPAIFENLMGKWRGQGLVKASPKGKNESIRCRMNTKPGRKEGRLDISGRCSVTGFVFSLNGFIQQNGNKNSYTASMFRSLANLKQSNFSGKRKGSKLDFTFRARDQISRQNIVANILLNSKSSQAFDVDISTTDPASGKVFKVGKIQFAKRG